MVVTHTNISQVKTFNAPVNGSQTKQKDILTIQLENKKRAREKKIHDLPTIIENEVGVNKYWMVNIKFSK
jgi:hypothetical protein